MNALDVESMIPVLRVNAWRRAYALSGSFQPGWLNRMVESESYHHWDQAFQTNLREGTLLWNTSRYLGTVKYKK